MFSSLAYTHKFSDKSLPEYTGLGHLELSCGGPWAVGQVGLGTHQSHFGGSTGASLHTWIGMRWTVEYLC